MLKNDIFVCFGINPMMMCNYKRCVMWKKLGYAAGIWVLIGSLCGACGGRMQKEKGELEQVRLVAEKSDLKRADVLEIAGLIHLETHDSCLVGYIPKLIKRSSGFYVWSAGQILKFDMAGRFLYRIHQKGRGPKEFLNIDAISVDGADRYLYLHDDQLQKLICYDALTGEYIRHAGLDYRAFAFTVMPDSKHFVFYCGFSPAEELEKGRHYPRFIVADSLGKVEKTFVYCDKNVNIPDYFSAKDVFSVLDSAVYCFANYNDTVFRISPALDIAPAFVLDYGNDNQQKNDVLVNKLGHLEKVAGSPEGMGVEDIATLARIEHTAKHWFFMGGLGDRFTFWLYDREKQKGINLGAVEEDAIIPDYFMAADADYFYTPVPVFDLKKMIAEKPERYDREMVEMIEKLDEDANPVIFKVKVKPM